MLRNVTIELREIRFVQEETNSGKENYSEIGVEGRPQQTDYQRKIGHLETRQATDTKSEEAGEGGCWPQCPH